MLALDAHVHVFDQSTMTAMRGVAGQDGITHFAAIVEDLALAEGLDAVGPKAGDGLQLIRCLPLQSPG